MPNTHKNKVIYNGIVLIDLTEDTVTPETLSEGYTAHDKSGALITGTADTTEGSVYQDEDGYLVVDDSESTAPQGNLSITQNGTYNVADYAGASVDIPVGMTETDLKHYITRSLLFTDIDWPDGITSIGSYAFAGCTNFDTEELPSGIKSIGTYAFFNCAKLALTSLPSGVARIDARAFSGCNKLALTSLPSGVTSITDYVFQNCHMLALTSLPSGIKSIPVYAFVNCYNLALMSLPSSLTAISNYAFQNCESITSIICDGAITSLGYCAFNGSSSHPMQLESASFPNMSVSNLYYTFGSATAADACQQLALCDIGSTSAITTNAFANCYALQTLVLRKSDSICTLSSVSAFTNTPMSGYNSLTGTVYVPSALISTYQTATNWSTLYNAGNVTFVAIEGSEHERD